MWRQYEEFPANLDVIIATFPRKLQENTKEMNLTYYTKVSLDCSIRREQIMFFVS